ncbi:hypothetical protein [Vulcanisaeta distributa]|uniref:hypothetical protein n=1 Tax=Vulcanisaeta distributa TaxID=164451 RepID=UPI001FB50269|nr:hypothetical protein [Vulcanisaeta distributa]
MSGDSGLRHRWTPSGIPPHNRALVKAVSDDDVVAELRNWDSINGRSFSVLINGSVIGDILRQSIANLVMLWDGG